MAVSRGGGRRRWSVHSVSPLEHRLCDPGVGVACRDLPLLVRYGSYLVVGMLEDDWTPG